MGANNFVNTKRKGKLKGMREAYRELCEEAVDYEGRQDGYNGTISTTRGFRDTTERFKAILKECNNNREKAYAKWQELAWGNTSKWDQCWGALVKERPKVYAFAGWAAE